VKERSALKLHGLSYLEKVVGAAVGVAILIEDFLVGAGG
jgi:hypothetical protein